ncbi:MAG TPA: hypothetical protein VNE61_03390 [Ktedonobacteraceae bacterium]|nr:hypothetical protein [Ktedonobacteraceae bacterium]
MKYTPRHLVRFAQEVLGKPLYPYQREAAEAILESVFGGHGRIITVMMARQSGKNQLSAVLEAFLLSCMQQGTIVKAAPTFTPQIINSRLRLLSLLDTPYTRERIWSSHGYIVGLAPSGDPALLHAHAGPRVMFYSAGLESNVVGATADLLLEIDEAQDVAPEKFDRDFRPMAAVSNATTVLYGTAWSDTTLLARQRAINLEIERQTGQQRHFEYDWRALAAINPAYRAFVEQEIARLGEAHLAVQTQYFLRPLSGAGYFLNALQQMLLRGSHPWQDAPRGGDWYIAGMDVAGEERPAQVGADALYSGGAANAGSHKRDSTVITIGRIYYNELNLPAIEVVHQQWWTGVSYLEQYAATVALVEQWDARALVIDATGLGAGLASLLTTRFGTERVLPFTFTRSSKSRLAYQLLALLNSGRLKLYTEQSAPSAIFAECWQQLRLARYRLPAPEVLDIYVDPSDGHDDFLISLALLTEGAAALATPAASTLVRPRRLYGYEGRF